jgi:hypothetical protein
MNEKLVVIAIALIVPAVAVIGIVILERKSIPAEGPMRAEIVLTIPNPSRVASARSDNVATVPVKPEKP